ncbi:MAG: hypothetical protein QOI36_1768 [Pseudonocardiales bacterium]|nr:hypothetical protein [Pseudonocardiales bacterium]
MNCLECVLSADPIERSAIGFCGYCSASICLEHAAITPIQPQPVGVVLAPTPGGRQLTCVVCTPRRRSAESRRHRPARAGATVGRRAA